MSDVIQLLPDSVANQIAAGEVIQRPASVIKELVENAVDAGATIIRVLVIDAGRTSIQVIDNGRGMSETDARLAFERHATSKIRQADDLFALRTMGFRGEALPSIAAVAQVELLTRTADDEVGTRLTLAASKVTAQEPVSCPVGCNFKVENLFYNVPARRKFLKTNTTELANIVTAFERIVLVYPAITFSLHSNGTEVLALKAGSLRQRIADVFGLRFSQDLLPLGVDTALCSISGFVGKPESARKKGSQQFFFVNGRYMRHAYFHKAVQSAYERLVAEGLQVPYFIYFDVAPADIDVNIHPTKTEIKFENEQTIWQILSASVRDAIGKFCEIPAINFDTEGRPDIPVFDPTRGDVLSPRVSYNADYNPFKPSKTPPQDHGTEVGAYPSADHPVADHSSGGYPSSGRLSAGRSSAPDGWERLYESLNRIPVASPAGQDDLFGPQDGGSLTDAETVIADKSPAHYQYKGRYVMTAVKSGLMIIDQHRASLRILFEHHLSHLAGTVVAPQRVLFPDVIQFKPEQQPVVTTLLPRLQTMGFDLNDLGGGSYAVNGIPPGVEGDPVSLVRNIIEEAMAQEGAVSGDTNVALALSMARATAVAYGQVLSNDEMESLVNQLFACANVNYTPDGHAILAILPQTDIDRLLV